MRWRLLFLISIIAALVAVTLWSSFSIALFGSARAMASDDWRLAGSLFIPLAVAIFSGVFAYRHTARRRKSQAVLTFVLALLFSSGFYLIASQLFPERLIIPRTSEVRYAR